jgi:serine O-acetyltransferase
LFKRLRNDIKVVLERDPAARHWFEVVTCYPGFKAVRSHRYANFWHRHGFKWLARWISKWSRFRTGVEIHPGAEIGPGFFIDHGMGVVIGETTIVGKNVTIYQGVVLGGTGKETGKRHPTIEDNVMIASGAQILGPFTVGTGSKIGAGSVVLEEVPPYSTVVGIPGRVVKRAGMCPAIDGGDFICETPYKRPACIDGECTHEQGAACGRCPGMASIQEFDLDQINLPDPVMQAIQSLERRISQLEKKLGEEEHKNENL